MTARILLIGTGPTTLDALEGLRSHFEVITLIRPGRDEAVRRAEALEIPVEADTSLGHIEELVSSLLPDCVVTSSYDRIIPDRLLKLCPFVNVHYAPLPLGRGRANVNWAIINGDSHTAVTVHDMAPGLDAGGILAQELIPINPDDTITSLYKKLNTRQRQLLPEAVSRRLTGDTGEPQDEAAATYGCTRLPQDGEIDWTASTEATHRLIRALGPPYPAAFTYLGLQKLHILYAEPLPDAPHFTGRVPGRVVLTSDHGVDVLTGDGVLRIRQVALGDGAPVPARALIRSVKTTLGLQKEDLLTEILRLQSR